MTTPAAGSAPWNWLGVYLVFMLAQRFYELAISARNERALRARGAIEHGAALYPWFVVLHALWPFGLIAEVARLGARPYPWWPVALVALLAAGALRVAAMTALGPMWTTRVWVVPGEHPLVRSGPYRWLRHPAYVAVTLELLAAPLMFGAWRTAIGAGAFNAVLLSLRIRDEERALGITTPELESPRR